MYKAQLMIDDAETILSRIKPTTQEGRDTIRRLLHIIEMAESLGEDVEDLTSEINFLREEVSRHLPYLPDDFD
ncbi:MAG: hypothetical protein SF029_13110 [bacterium]|nr:hypothetical protein [bacterium]